MTRTLEFLENFTLTRKKVNNETLAVVRPIALKRMISAIKENGVQCEGEQMIISEISLKESTQLSENGFNLALDYGVRTFNLKKEKKNNVPSVVLISEEINLIPQDTHAKQKSIGRSIINSIERTGQANETGERSCNQALIRKKLKVNDLEYKLGLDYCLKHSCIKIHQDGNKTYLILLKTEFNAPCKDIDELKDRLLELLKKAENETEEGYLFMTEKSLLDILEISESSLKKVVNYGFTFHLFKFDIINEEKVVVYTQERRVSCNDI